MSPLACCQDTITSYIRIANFDTEYKNGNKSHNQNHTRSMRERVAIAGHRGNKWCLKMIALPGDCVEYRSVPGSVDFFHNHSVITAIC